MFLSASESFAAWYQGALLQAKVWKAKTDYPFPITRCSISMICFFPDMRNHDLDGIVSGVLDMLKTPRPLPKGKNDKGVGIIKDDDWKLLRPLNLDAGISKQTPRIEVFITPIADLSIRTK